MYNIDSTLPPLFCLRECVMGWLHCDVTCGLLGQYEQRLNWSLLNWLPLSSTLTWMIRGGYSYRINIKEKNMYFRWRLLRCTCTEQVWEGEELITGADINECLLLEFHIVLRYSLLTCRWNPTAMPSYNDLNNSTNLFAIIQLSRLNTCNYLCNGLYNQHWRYLNMPLKICFSSPLCSQTNVFTFSGKIEVEQMISKKLQLKRKAEVWKSVMFVHIKCPASMLKWGRDIKKKRNYQQKCDCRFLLNFLRCISKWWCIFKHNQ